MKVFQGRKKPVFIDRLSFINIVLLKREQIGLR